MNKKRFNLSTMLPAMAFGAVLCLATQPTFAQSTPDSHNATTQQSMPDNQSDQNTTSQKTFSGKIVKAGDKLVLSVAGNTYQLDDQQKAQDFLNKSVKVTGVLDASTGTIRVSAIEPA